MDSRPPNSTLLVAFVKFDKFDHDFYTFFALILHDLALSVYLLTIYRLYTKFKIYKSNGNVPIGRLSIVVLYDTTPYNNTPH